MGINEASVRFLEYCELDKNLSLKTVRMYSYYIGFFRDWLLAEHYPEYRRQRKRVIEEATRKARQNNETNDEDSEKSPKKLSVTKSVQAAVSDALEILQADYDVPVTKITAEDIRKFRLYISNRYKNPHKGDLKRQTQNYFLVALRSMFRYLIKQGHTVLSPEMIELGKRKDRTVKFLEVDQLKALFNAPDTTTDMGLRDRTILEVLFSTGLRVSELCALNRDQINLDTGEFGVIGKGGKARVVFISQDAKLWLHNYLKTRTDSWRPLFIRYSGPREDDELSVEAFRLSVRSIERMIDKYRIMAGIPFRIGPHVLRHSFATDLITHGADLRSVQEMLGHKNIATTQIYTHVTNPQLREIHSKFHSGNKG